MCTLIIVHNVNASYPLVIGANRDEAYDRGSEGPSLLQEGPFPVIAPRDTHRGGTWIGASHGWFVGLTNQDTNMQRAPARKSRGDVVRDCLLLTDVDQVMCYLNGIEPSDYNPFNLVFGHPGCMFLCRVHHDRPISVEVIDDGITIIANDCSRNNGYRRRRARAHHGASAIDRFDDGAVVIDKLVRTLSSHDGGHEPLQALCVHDDANNHGTRSSAIILFSQAGEVDYHHKEGHACQLERLSQHMHLSP